jgi:hypothetical protein
MSGRIISKTPEQHHCAPGWEKGEPFAAVPGVVRMRPPSLWDYPPGTRWQCDACGGVWVSTGQRTPNWFAPGFRPETWWERRRRRKQESTP